MSDSDDDTPALTYPTGKYPFTKPLKSEAERAASETARLDAEFAAQARSHRAPAPAPSELSEIRADQLKRHNAEQSAKVSGVDHLSERERVAVEDLQRRAREADRRQAEREREQINEALGRKS